MQWPSTHGTKPRMRCLAKQHRKVSVSKFQGLILWPWSLGKMLWVVWENIFPSASPHC